jgi:sugar phosphate isomerase/epimerase
VHAKYTRIDPANSLVHGNLDTKSYGDVPNRSWVFRTVGYGHGDEFWKAFISVLRTHGYDGVLSIEHEDSLMSTSEGFEKAVAYRKNMLLREKTGQAWWF